MRTVFLAVILAMTLLAFGASSRGQDGAPVEDPKAKALFEQFAERRRPRWQTETQEIERGQHDDRAR